ncbi:MAG TPA: DUF429 domain-containing protein [Burkholderiales bacterium]|nr:DUF429 domain-containing protein [Burkholderiales bacterium]
MVPGSCVGVDGCRTGWLAVTQDPRSGRIVPQVYESAAELCSDLARAAVIAVDVPIGLTDCGPRWCDLEARKRLGRLRGSSVFPAPVRAVLAATAREQASRIQERADGRRIGVQIWNIVPKIREWDEVLRANRALAGRVFEAHPEISFWALGGFRPMRHGKKTAAGRQQRHRLIGRAFGNAVPQARWRPGRDGVAVDDLLDALAALWTARRIANGEARSLPASPTYDAAGLPMAIWY